MSKRRLTPRLDAVPCPWTQENSRHDHQLIFDMAGPHAGSLLLVWCEYYADRPSHVLRDPTELETGFMDEAPCRISARLSADKARTWGPRFTLQANRWRHNVKHPNLVRLEDGTVLFTFTAWESEGARNVYLRRSSDEMESWSEPVMLSEPGWYCNNHDRALTLSTGRILLPAHGVVGGGPYLGGQSKLCSWVWYSDDGFRTWHRGAEVTCPGRGAHEPTIVERRDGSLLCFLRTTTTKIWRTESHDGGQTWAEPRRTEFDAPDAESLLTRIPQTGDLLLLWNDVPSEKGTPRTPLTAAISGDDGETWRVAGDIDDRDDFHVAYPSAHFQEDEVVISYYTRDNARWARDSELALRIYGIDELYR
jgi:sialidase-1